MVIDLLKSWKEILIGMMGDQQLLSMAIAENEWFTAPLLQKAITAVLPWFEGNELENLRTAYPAIEAEKRVGLILAGNLPFVGLHDVVMVLLSGHLAVAKPSHKDSVLLTELISKSNPALRERVRLVDQIVPEEIDFLIATGTNHTARQIEAAFPSVRKLIRHNRFSIALLEEDASESMLEGLAKDVLMYHGMGCRSVSSVLVPKGFPLQRLVNALDSVDSSRFAPCWWDVLRYERALQSMVGESDLPCKNITVIRATELKPGRIGVLNVVEYVGMEDVSRKIQAVAADLQCVIGANEIPFGRGQSPRLDDFADGVDTLGLLTLGNWV